LVQVGNDVFGGNCSDEGKLLVWMTEDGRDGNFNKLNCFDNVEFHLGDIEQIPFEIILLMCL
jgi:hypothetical protein